MGRIAYGLTTCKVTCVSVVQVYIIECTKEGCTKSTDYDIMGSRTYCRSHMREHGRETKE